MLLDECGNSALERCNAAVNATSDLAICQRRKEAFDLVEPGSCWSVSDERASAVCD
jgi:hypothetical protein